VVENQVDQQELVVTVTDPKHSVYIYNCSGSVVQVGGCSAADSCAAELACPATAAKCTFVAGPGWLGVGGWHCCYCRRQHTARRVWE
jgi:hypothetical protein